jgi:hypothetical protein
MFGVSSLHERFPLGQSTQQVPVPGSTVAGRFAQSASQPPQMANTNQDNLLHGQVEHHETDKVILIR